MAHKTEQLCILTAFNSWYLIKLMSELEVVSVGKNNDQLEYICFGLTDIKEDRHDNAVCCNLNNFNLWRTKIRPSNDLYLPMPGDDFIMRVIIIKF